MKLDMERIEIIEDLATGEVAATCTLDEFIEANADWPPLGEEEVEFLVTNGYVVLGGGATPIFVIRYARAREASSQHMKELVTRLAELRK